MSFVLWDTLSGVQVIDCSLQAHDDGDCVFVINRYMPRAYLHVQHRTNNQQILKINKYVLDKEID